MSSYVCCTKNFTEVDKLIFHLEYVHNVTSYTCRITKCYRSFHTCSVFKNHLRNLHNFSKDAKAVSLFQRTNQSYCILDISSPESSSVNQPGTSTERAGDSHTNKNKCVNQNTLNKSVAEFVTNLYSNLTINRNCVQFIISAVNSCFLKGPIQAIKDFIKLYSQKEDVINCDFFTILTQLLTLFENSLDNYNTEYKRIKYLQEFEKFIAPEQYKIGVTNDVKRGTKNSLILKPLSSAHISLARN